MLVDATELAWQRTRRDRQPILRHRTATTDLEFDPVAFLERLAVLVPRPRVNLILYHHRRQIDEEQPSASRSDSCAK